MTVYVIRDGKLVEKFKLSSVLTLKERFPAPRISRIEPFESPVTGREITSWRERDRDMAAADAVDPRDFPRDHQFKRGRAAQLKEAKDGRTGSDDPFWR